MEPMTVQQAMANLEQCARATMGNADTHDVLHESVRVVLVRLSECDRLQALLLEAQQGLADAKTRGFTTEVAVEAEHA